ncbi:hypothetical protein HYH03_017705 [Edaphochlamys debaryana]|uniref:Uncharacterized protein n=1 Tax=Edaphochlamys debaryana TaxID=47281 RepID=A0A835XGS3_9CHLO|nr:hypothetical protein HYH03_017705 [Edaphochlamys debaryana]|eukprot:KAG2483451.1 hypothetical protein HYH03_017705 [Edaphochlamys debaryana]
MGIVPMTLGNISKPLERTYKVCRTGLAVRGAALGHSAFGIFDALFGYTLDVKGAVRISLSWLAIKFVHGKIRTSKLAGKTHAFLDDHRPAKPNSGDPDTALAADLDALLTATGPLSRSPSTAGAPPSATPAAAPASTGPATMARASSGGLPRSASFARPVPPKVDPMIRAGLLFLRDALARLASGEAEAARRFMDKAGHLDVRSALLAFYSTPSSRRLADALAGRGPRENRDGVGRQRLLDRVYADLRVALRNDALNMFVW